MIDSYRQATMDSIADRIEAWVQSLEWISFIRRITVDQRQWIRRTEQLWLAVYESVLSSPSAEAAEILLRYESIYTVYVRLGSNSSSSELNQAVEGIAILEAQVPGPWRNLMEHLEQASGVGIGDDELLHLSMEHHDCLWLDGHKRRLRRYRGY